MAGKPRVYDCFLFYNELDLLELRLKTLWDKVDQFVIYEGEETFSGKSKPLYFAGNVYRFAEWMPKIRHVVVPKRDVTPWEREYFARDWMPMGFQDADHGDIIFQSDADEIWHPLERDSSLDRSGPLVYGQRMFYYRLNTERVPRIVWYGSRRIRAGEWFGGQALRNVKQPVLQDGGWHFSFLGDADNAVKKLKAYSHTEYSGPEWADSHRIAPLIDTGVDLINPEATYQPVPIDMTFPSPVIEDRKRWQKWIR